MVTALTLLVACGDVFVSSVDASRDPDIPESFVDTRGRGGRAIFFPPNAPPLDGSLVFSPVGQPEIGAPAGLGEFVNEPFYSPFATLRAERALDETVAGDIRRYHAERKTLERELIETMRDLRDLSPESRQRALSALRSRQTPALARLEEEAMTIRERLVSGRLLMDDGADWNAMRRWRLGREAPRAERERYLVLEYQVMRAAPFYQEGLSPAQRRLMREVVMNLEAAAFDLQSPADGRPFIFFLPEGARIRLPEDPSARLAGMLSAFLEQKAALRRELREAVYDADAAFFPVTREHQLRECASRQAQPFELVESQAEEIREQIAREQALERIAPPSPLPARMEALIRAYEAERASLEAELDKRVARRIREEIPAHFTSKMEARSLPYKATKIRQREEPRFREENRERFEHLETLLEDFHAEMLEAAAADERAFAISAGLQDVGWGVADFLDKRSRTEGIYLYDIAVLEPGLSPEQRRLLFDGALARLGLPLPGGQTQPMYFPKTVAR